MRLSLKPAILERLTKQEGAVLTYESVSGVEVLGSLKQVPRVGWAVLAEIPVDTAYQQVRRFRDLTLAIVAGLLLGVTAIAYRLALLIVRPLERLTKGAAEVAEGDLAVDLPTATGEVGDLTYVFNHMVGRLRQSRQELDAVNETLRQQNEELERLSASDSLTGLSNRRILTQRLSEELLRAQRQSHSFTVLMLDVDHFKKYNDAYGHPAGDEVLKKVANILRNCTRAGDCTARYGGEEFAVLLSGKSGDTALQLAERIRERVAAEEFVGGKVTISGGIAEFPHHGHTAEAVISSADEALYEAKRAGSKPGGVRPPQAEAGHQAQLGPGYETPEDPAASPAVVADPYPLIDIRIADQGLTRPPLRTRCGSRCRGRPVRFPVPRRPAESVARTRFRPDAARRAHRRPGVARAAPASVLAWLARYRAPP